LHRLDYFLGQPLQIFAFWQGGLGIWGAIFGGLFGFFLSAGKIGGVESGGSIKSTVFISKDIMAYLDVFAVCAPLAQAIGRWGNYFNKELFGYPTNLPWGIYIPPQLRPEQFKYYDTFHPLFLYESILNLLLFVFLYKLYRRNTFAKNHFSGLYTLIYLMGYSLSRLILDFIRVESWMVYGFPVSSAISLAVLVTSSYLLVKSLRKSRTFSQKALVKR